MYCLMSALWILRKSTILQAIFREVMFLNSNRCFFRAFVMEKHYVHVIRFAS